MFNTHHLPLLLRKSSSVFQDEGKALLWPAWPCTASAPACSSSLLSGKAPPSAFWRVLERMHLLTTGSLPCVPHRENTSSLTVTTVTHLDRVLRSFPSQLKCRFPRKPSLTSEFPSYTAPVCDDLINRALSHVTLKSMRTETTPVFTHHCLHSS